MQTMILLLLCVISLLECGCLLFFIFLYIWDKPQKAEPTAVQKKEEMSERERKAIKEAENVMEGICAILGYNGGVPHGTDRE